MAWDHESKLQEAHGPEDKEAAEAAIGAHPSRRRSDAFTCPGCGKHTYGGMAYCPDCGSRLLHECPQCGRQWWHNHKYSFCPKCGGELNPREGTGDPESSRGKQKASAQTGETA